MGDSEGKKREGYIEERGERRKKRKEEETGTNPESRVQRPASSAELASELRFGAGEHYM